MNIYLCFSALVSFFALANAVVPSQFCRCTPRETGTYCLQFTGG